MEIAVDFPGGLRVDAHFGSFVVGTDQPVKSGGEGSLPAPFELFLASLATCAGFYVLGFCKARQIATDGIRLIQKVETNPVTKLISKVLLEIQLPQEFPQHYESAVIRAAESCLVKKTVENPPVFEVTTSVVTVA
jgi:putative redox protein